MEDMLKYVEDNDLNIDISPCISRKWEIVLENRIGSLLSGKYFLIEGKGDTISEAWKLCLKGLNSKILKEKKNVLSKNKKAM